MGFLRKRDYFTEIKEKDLDVILKEISQNTAESPTKIRQTNELNMQDVLETRIRHRYEVKKIFKEILTFSTADTFQIGDLVQYSETAYDATLTYVSPNRVSFSQTVSGVLKDEIFQANAAVAVGESPLTTPAKWDLIVDNFELFFAEQPTTGNLPDAAFDFTDNNFTGNHKTIFGWDKTNSIFLKRIESRIKIYYSAADRTNDANSIGVVDFDSQSFDSLHHDHDHSNIHHDRHHKNHRTAHRFDPSIKQFPTSIPILFGDDRENSLAGELTITGFIPLDTTWDVVPSNFFTKGDNRSRTIKKILINLAVFELHKLINPRNIPDLRLEAKDDAMMILKEISSGKIQADLPLHFDEDRGQSITFGSNPRRHHRY